MDPEAQVTRNKNILPGVLISVLLTALLVGGGVYLYQKNQTDKTQNSLQAQIDSLKSEMADTKQPVITPNSTTPTTSTAVSGSTENWKTYTDVATGLTLKYPSDLALNTPSPTKGSGMEFSVAVQQVSNIPAAPLWYGPDVAKEEMAALTKGDISNTHGGQKLLSLNDGAVGATAMNLATLTCDNTMFNREAHIYRNNYQILIRLDDLNVTTIKANNPDYFAISKECSGDNSTEKVWSKADQFKIDVAAGKTDVESQKWYTTFDKILSTVSFK